MMCQTLAAWLYLHAGVSRATVNKLLASLHLILVAMLSIITLVLAGFALPSLGLDRDVRTVIARMHLEPEISRSVCCPKCFSAYTLDQLPEICMWRETPRSNPCGERLQMRRHTRRNGVKLVPRALYSRQSFDSWLRFFLSRPDTEKWLDESYAHVPSVGAMHGIWDSPAWQSLFTFTGTNGNLTFSLYIDWFNPLTNKISGKKISCGAIILCCMNLPPELRHLPENVFFAGIIPGPKEPSIVTMTHALQPIVDELKPFWTGKTISTHRSPQGRLIRVALIPLVADLLAMRKMAGFGAHSCKYFCSYCLCTLDEIHRLDVENFEPRRKDTVQKQAKAWRAAPTKKGRKEEFRTCGVRWSPLHDLPYWDPVRHLVLGYMHNTLEGILQNHARSKWGIGSLKHRRDDEAPGGYDSELFALEDESSGHDDTPQESVRQRSASSTLDYLSSLASVPPESEDDPMDGDDPMDEDESVYQPSDEGSDEEDPQPLEHALAPKCTFTKPELELIRTCFRDAGMPTSMERPPGNFGEASHGRLKAIAWLTTFTNFLPMVVPEIWAGEDASAETETLLQNFYDLVASTNIISSYTFTPGDDADYLQHFVSYRRSCIGLFSHSTTVPNHHYALHNPELMRFWGPLPPLSEFQYEQKNGMMQRINTNRHICMLFPFFLMHLTYLSRRCGSHHAATSLTQRSSGGIPARQAPRSLGSRAQSYSCTRRPTSAAFTPRCARSSGSL